ncbi:hypothetical protein LCGC14_2571710 [marine sediment metagenome]|uniref:Uncharacterized protein n=1 Tax=marine sediment metagenome TaxID=412755 RepID=A0A0F9D9Z0_9ZZZZ
MLLRAVARWCRWGDSNPHEVALTDFEYFVSPFALPVKVLVLYVNYLEYMDNHKIAN